MSEGVVAVDVGWEGVVLVCGKCSRKLDGGFGRKGREGLGRVLKDGLRAAGRRRVRVVEVGCLGICPRKAVVVVAPGGGVFSVRRGADVAGVAAVLGGVAADATLDRCRSG